MMFKFQRFASSSFCLFQDIKYSESTSKLNRILCNSGCLITGCCFSIQSDEEPLVPTDGSKNKYKNFPKIFKKRDIDSSFSNKQPNSNSKNMKRNFESISDNISSNTVAQECVELSTKKKKTDNETTNGENIQVKVPVVQPVSPALAEPCTPHEEKHKEEKSKRLRPNYFVAIKISDDQIHHELKELQAHISREEERLKRSMIELKTLHITLFVMHIGDTETHARAVKTLEDVYQEHNEEMSKNPLQLKFQGLGHFQNRVLYAKLLTDDSFQRLCLLAESVKKHFTSASIFSTDSRQNFTPHLTVAKIDFKKKHNKFIKKIHPTLYKDFSNHYFGSQNVEGIQLLSMLDPKNEAGYYSGNELYFSAFNPSAKLDSLNSLLETEEKKKNVKHIINALMKEKLK